MEESVDVKVEAIFRRKLEKKPSGCVLMLDFLDFMTLFVVLETILHDNVFMVKICETCCIDIK